MGLIDLNPKPLALQMQVIPAELAMGSEVTMTKHEMLTKLQLFNVLIRIFHAEESFTLVQEKNVSKVFDQTSLPHCIHFWIIPKHAISIHNTQRHLASAQCQNCKSLFPSRFPLVTKLH